MESKMKLVVQAGAHKGEEYPLDAEVLRLGREEARTIPLDDPMVSRRHAEINCLPPSPGGRYCPPGQRVDWVITDLGSTNGTFVNDERVSGSHRLRPGDRIRVGSTVLSLESQEGDRRFRNALAFLIALTTLMGAVVAYWISVASDDASTADSRGLAILRQRAAEETSIAAQLRQHQDAFVPYHWRAVLADLLAQAVERASAEDETLAADLERERLSYARLAATDLHAVTAFDYWQRAARPIDERFDAQGFTQAALAEAASRQELDATPYFEQANRERARIGWLALAAVVLSGSIFFYTGAEVSRGGLKIVLAAAGLALFVLASLAANIVEFMV